jgi:hypothetical protein
MKRTRTSSIMSPDLYLRAHAMFFNQLEILSTWKATTTRGIYNASEMLTIQIQYYTQVMSKGSGGFLRIYFSTNGIASFPFSLTGKDSRLIAKKAAMSESGSCSLPLAPTRSSLPAIHLTHKNNRNHGKHQDCLPLPRRLVPLLPGQLRLLIQLPHLLRSESSLCSSCFHLFEAASRLLVREVR